jgi:TonB family protein
MKPAHITALLFAIVLLPVSASAQEAVCRARAGQFCASGTTTAQACTQGSFCVGRTAPPIACPAGSYCPTRASRPRACPAGKFCEAGSSAPADCPEGSFCPASSREPIPCPDGFVCAARASWPRPARPGEAAAVQAAAPPAFGFGGLGLRGTGRGGGGSSQGTIGLGNLGSIGHGGGSGSGSGYGSGSGGLSGHRAPIPRVQTGSADVRGELSREIIRRVVRRHINEVRFCYEQELNAHPELQGRVSVRFVIDASGVVTSSAIAESTLGAPRVEGCIVTAVRRWSFPAPDGGGEVSVVYPFVLSAQRE